MWNVASAVNVSIVVSKDSLIERTTNIFRSFGSAARSRAAYRRQSDRLTIGSQFQMYLFYSRIL